MILVDSNILIDVLKAQTEWHNWSLQQLKKLKDLGINSIIYAEASLNFDNVHVMDAFLKVGRLRYVPVIPKEALMLAAQTHQQYRRQGGSKEMILPDFLIGAHATVAKAAVLTRDAKHYRKYFPRLKLIHP